MQVTGTFNREYDNKARNSGNLKSIDDVCGGLFTESYDRWKGVGLSRFEHIMEHLKASGEIDSLTFGKFVNVLKEHQFIDTLRIISDCINETSTSNVAQNSQESFS